MTTPEQQAAETRLLEQAVNGNAEAQDWLAHYWIPYVSQVDDIVDGQRPNPQDQLATFALAAEVFSHPFYLKNLGPLRQVARNVAVAYAGSVAWETSEIAWQREWADHYRHAGLEMILAVAAICVPAANSFAAANALNLPLRALVHAAHHDANGNPI